MLKLLRRSYARITPTVSPAGIKSHSAISHHGFLTTIPLPCYPPESKEATFNSYTLNTSRLRL